jgi:hypothetical protein
MNEIKIVMIKTGQFLIGNITEVEDGLIVREPLEIMINPTADQNGNLVPQVGMFPFCLMSKTRDFKFTHDNIITGPLEPDEQCHHHYIKSTSRIEIATPEMTRLVTG